MSFSFPLSESLRQAVDGTLSSVEVKDKDEKDRSEEEALALNHLKATVEGAREDNRNKKANRRLRWRYARWVFHYLICYSIVAGIFVVLHGFKICGFQLPEIALGALVGSTAVAAIGLVASVVSGLFRS